MADIKIISQGCNDDCDDDDDRDDDDGGKRGKRGKRGHRGEQGEPGPIGPSGLGLGGLLKFSGVVDASVEGTIVSYLADTGVGVGDVSVITVAPDYPVAIVRNLVNLATNVLEAISINGTLTIELLKNGVAVPGFVITYTGGQSGIKTVTAGPVAFAIGDTFDLRLTASFLAVGVDVTATVGVQ